MSLKRNILASYASQIYVTAVGIVMVPLYIQYMGAEAYGLVGFFAMLQVWFNMLDMGLTPTVARESARFNGGAISLLEYRRLVRALEGVFVVVALVGGGGLFALAQSMATQWLNANHLPVSELTHALQIMAIIVALRWMCGLYRGVVSGAERLVWLSSFSSLIATVRFVLILPVLMFVSATPTTFFGYQLGVAILELSGLALIAYRLLPAVPAGQRIHWQWAPLKPVLKFSLSIAFTSSIWVLVTQTDKLILSKILPLADYGYFTVAVLVASGIMMVTGPISNSIMPRMARLNSEGQHKQLLVLYRQATQLVTVISLPTALVLSLFSKQVLWAWTGDSVLAEKAGPVLSLYAVGSGFLALGAFPYYLQYAKGNLRLHVIGNALFVLFLIPSLIWAGIEYGMIGAGWTWLVSNAVYFFFWTPLVHRSLLPMIHWQWLFEDIGRIALIPAAIGLIIAHFSLLDNSRWWLIIELIFIGLILLVIGYGMSTRLKIHNK